MLGAFFVFNIVLVLPLTLGQEIQYKICGTAGNNDACQQVARTGQLACNENYHSVDCLLNIDHRLSHVGRISAEEALLGASQLQSDNVQVLGEIETDYAPPQTVVIIRSSVPANIIDLKGKKLCHPGYNHDVTFPKLFLQELEQKVIDLNDGSCTDKSITLAERHVQLLANFFGESCRPGTWTQDKTSDQLWKQKYSSLCKLCGGGGCDVTYKAPFADALSCLTEKDGDVAVTTLREAMRFFSKSSNAQNYKYFCKNSTSSAPGRPCTWSNQLPSLLVAEKNSLNDIRRILQTHLRSKIRPNVTGGTSDSNSAVENALTSILKLRRFETIRLFADREYKSLSTYVNERRTIPQIENSYSKKCDRTLKWCTYSDLEHEKCQWFSQAALNSAIQPAVECIQAPDEAELSCIANVQKGDSDIVVASADYGYLLLRKDLTGVAYVETDTRNLSKILLVKKESDSSISSFADLRDKKACIPEYGGKEFTVFINAAKERGVMDDECDYGKLFSDFVGDSCAPGVLTREREASLLEDNAKEKLCRLCRTKILGGSKTAIFCEDSQRNMYYGNKGAVTCLHNDGDFAVITDTGLNSDLTNLRVICKDGSLASKTGVDVDVNCALNIITSSVIAAKNNNSKNPDIVMALREFDRAFGQDIDKPFHLFNVFNRTRNLLFEDSTLGLDVDGHAEYVGNYKKMLEDVTDCSDPSGTEVFTPSLILIICALPMLNFLF